MTGAFVTPFHFLFLSCLLASLLTVVSTAVLLFVPLVLIEVPELVAVPLASAIYNYSTYLSSYDSAPNLFFTAMNEFVLFLLLWSRFFLLCLWTVMCSAKVLMPLNHLVLPGLTRSTFSFKKERLHNFTATPNTFFWCQSMHNAQKNPHDIPPTR